MRALRRLLPAMVMITALVPGLPAALVSSLPAARAAAGGAPPGCHYSFQPPSSWVLQCSNGGGNPGGPGSGGGSGSSKYACTLTPLSPDQIKFLGLSKPPKGDKWEAITCPGRQPFGGVTLVSANGTPAVTPQELLQIAIGELHVPALQPATAPPLGRDGLVGLPEWFWIPSSEWHPVTVTVSAGPVWAQAVATPQQVTFYPGGGLPGASCAGPGSAYSSRPGTRPACSYNYPQSSALQPGGAYAATVSVTWRVTWTGSGGTGGVIDSALQVGFPVTQRVAEGQALVTAR